MKDCFYSEENKHCKHPYFAYDRQNFLVAKKHRVPKSGLNDRIVQNKCSLSSERKLFLGVALIYEAIYWKIKQTVNCIKNRMYYRNGLLYMPTVMPNELPEMMIHTMKAVEFSLNLKFVSHIKTAGRKGTLNSLYFIGWGLESHNNKNTGSKTNEHT